MNNMVVEKSVPTNKKLYNSIKSRMSLFKSTNNIKYVKECVELFITDLTQLNRELRELQYNIINIEKIDNEFHLIKDSYTLKELQINNS